MPRKSQPAPRTHRSANGFPLSNPIESRRPAMAKPDHIADMAIGASGPTPGIQVHSMPSSKTVGFTGLPLSWRECARP